jgi:hypothetical protein
MPPASPLKSSTTVRRSRGVERAPGSSVRSDRCSSVRARSRHDAQCRQAKFSQIAALLARGAAVRGHAAATDQAAARHEDVAEGRIEPGAVRLGRAVLVLPCRRPVRCRTRCPSGATGALAARPRRALRAARPRRALSPTGSRRALSTTRTTCGLSTTRSRRALSIARLVRRLVIQHVRRAPTAGCGQRDQRRNTERNTFHRAKLSSEGASSPFSRPPSRTLYLVVAAARLARAAEDSVQFRPCAVRRHRRGVQWCFSMQRSMGESRAYRACLSSATRLPGPSPGL